MWFISLVALWGGLTAQGVRADAQSVGWGSSGASIGPHFEMEYERPEVHRWYTPRHLLEDYAQPWYASEGGYARDFYSRYVDRALEGEAWYDTFGRPLGNGWLVYDWEENRPQREGSVITRNKQAYNGFFQRLVIAADGGRHGSYRLMVGEGIYTQFTPLTFSKPRFEGIRLDGATDWGTASLILSRPSSLFSEGSPLIDRLGQTNATHLAGGHTSFQLTPTSKVGFTYVNARNTQAQLDFSFGNPLHGDLTTEQNQPLKTLWVRIRDDSPADREGGATVFSHEIVLVGTDGRQLRGRDIGLRPRIEGGRQQAGTLVANGTDILLLEYDLQDLNIEGKNSGAIQRAWVELTIANDYSVEMASDLQTDGQKTNPEIIFLPVERAAGKVQDETNSRVLKLDYGLPTGNEVLGMDWDLVQWKGLSVQGEAVLNRQFRRYPNAVEWRQHLTVDQAHAAYIYAAYDRSPWGVFGEAFSIEDHYSTSYWLTKSGGQILYKSPVPQRYEFVEDDDDYDGIPEWVRPFQPSSNGLAWPGYDENRDFIHDYNQNQNLIPDYEEPFLRFHADRPAFLFGMDLNHNNTIDRFENDNEPDYPYKRDHQGFNVYASAQLGPEARLSLGHQRVKLIAGDGRARSFYTLFTWTRDTPPLGRFRLFEFGEVVRDDIPDDLSQWVQPSGAAGRMREVVDPLSARNTWKNVFYGDLDQRLGNGMRFLHRIKSEVLAQRDRQEEVRLNGGRKRSGFLGMVNKAEWLIPLGLGHIEPRLKSEFRQDWPYSTLLPRATSLEETCSLLWTQPLLSERTVITYYAGYGRQLFDTELQLGLEASRFWMLKGAREEVDQDFRQWTWVVQFVNRVAYQGYRVVTRVGILWGRQDFARAEDQHRSLLFFSMNAGLK